MCVQDLFLTVKRERIKVRCGAVSAPYARSLAECAADRGTAAGLVEWDAGVWGLGGLGCMRETLSPVEP